MELDFVKATKKYKYAVYSTKSKNRLGTTGKWSIKKDDGKNSYVVFSMTADDDLHFNLFNKSSNPEIVFDKECLFYRSFVKLLGGKNKLEIQSDMHGGNKVLITKSTNSVKFSFECSEDQTNNPISIKNRMNDIRSHRYETDLRKHFLECCYEMNCIVEDEMKLIQGFGMV
ncbi:MAG: hypothetical protein PHR96_02945 [Clostridia bacterium]|nr:hypothetical protein [Clostridia bacterium]